MKGAEDDIVNGIEFSRRRVLTSALLLAGRMWREMENTLFKVLASGFFGSSISQKRNSRQQ